MWNKESFPGMAKESTFLQPPDDDDDGDDDDDDVMSNHDDDKEACSSQASSTSSPDSPACSTQSSFHQAPAAWPQSYRQSMDIYSSFGSPAISNLSPSTACFSSSLLSSSVKRRSQFFEKTSSFTASFLSTKGDQEEASSYDPLLPKYASFKHTEDYHGIPGQCSATQGTLNGINVLCGVGILTTPYALQEGGWFSLFLFLVLAVMAFYTGILLRCCLDSQSGLVTYPDIGQAAFGITGRIFISIFLYMELYANCVEYLILEGDNLSAAFPNATMNVNGFRLTGRELFAIVTAIFVLPTVWLRNLSLLSYISAAGVGASFLVLICVAWVGCVDGVGFHNSGPLLKLSTLPVSIGLYGYCYSGHSVFPNIYSSLKDPSNFSKIMIISFTVCTIMYGGMATMGFTMFGDDTQNQITLSLPSNSLASKVALWSTIINPFTKYAINITPVALSLEELLPSPNYTMKSYGFSLAIRTTLVVSTLCVALLVPFFEYVMAFIGSFLSMMLCLIFPASCFLKLSGRKLNSQQKVFCMAIILVGFLCCIVGTYSSLYGILNNL